MEERCILAPRKGQQGEDEKEDDEYLPESSTGKTTAAKEGRSSSSSSSSSSSGGRRSPRRRSSSSEASLFVAHIRHYGGCDPDTGTTYPYAVCLQGVLHQVCPSYYKMKKAGKQGGDKKKSSRRQEGRETLFCVPGGYI